MKKVTLLLRPKSKKAKDAQYNALSGVNGNGGSACIDASGTEPMPAIHNYGKSKTKVKTKTTKIQPTKVKLTSTHTKNQSASSKTRNAAYATAALERASSSSTTDNNNFNYSSLNRKRNSYSNSSCGSIITRDTATPTATASTASKQPLQKRRSYSRKRWWRRLLCYSRCAFARRKRATQPHNRYKDYWNEPTKIQKRHRYCSCRDGWRKRVGAAKCWRWCCLPCCCCDRRIGSYPYDSEEDDDIDGKFAAYIYEMQQRDMVAFPTASADPTPTIATTQLQSMPTKALATTKQAHSLMKTTERVIELGSAPVVGACNVTPLMPPTAFVYRRRSSNGGLLKLKPRAWTWDDSLRSNSDRFLETLEEDELNAPHVCSFVARRPPLLAPTAEVHKREGIPTTHMGTMVDRTQLTVLIA